MQTFIPTVVSAIQVLLKGPAWLLQKLISIFAGWNEALPSQDIPLSSGICSQSDSPYELPSHPPQRRVYNPYVQISAPSQHSTANQAPSQHPPHPPRRQSSTLYSTKTAPQAPRDRDAPPVAKPVKQPPRHATTVAPEANVAPLATNLSSHEDPESLRFKARLEGDRMAECFRKSKAAFVGNDKGHAKELSLEGQVHKQNMERLNKEASAKIFQENNEGSPPNTVDLHGLYVAEAEFYFQRTVKQADREQSLRVIVGRGNHSDGNIPRIKPAIQDLGERLGMTVDVDPGNNGCLIVNF